MTPYTPEQVEALKWYETNDCVCGYSGNEDHCTCRRSPRGRILAALVRSQAEEIAAMKARACPSCGMGFDSQGMPDTVKLQGALIFGIEKSLAAMTKERDEAFRLLAKYRPTGDA